MHRQKSSSALLPERHFSAVKDMDEDVIEGEFDLGARE